MENKNLYEAVMVILLVLALYFYARWKTDKPNKK